MHDFLIFVSFVSMVALPCIVAMRVRSTEEF